MSITSTAATTSATTSTGISGASTQISSDAFLSLLTAELQNQDPLEPMDGQAMVTQLAQLTTVSELSKLNTNFTESSGIQLAAQVGSLVGHTVQWYDSDTGRLASAEVTSVELSGSEWVLNAGEDQVPLDSILAIS